MQFDALIVGQGLAGTLLAWEAHWAGLRIALVDPGHSETASRVAAGIINPMTGRRLSKSWDFDRLFPAAEAFYRRVEGELDGNYLHLRPILRCLDLEESQAAWRKKRELDEYRSLWTADTEALRPLDSDWFLPTELAFATSQSGNLAIENFLDDSRAFFSKHHHLVEAETSLDSLQHLDERVVLEGLNARFAISCQGAKATESRYFEWLPLRRAKGEVLELELPGCEESRIVNRGKWILPRGENRFLAGSSYDWAPQDELPSDKGVAEVELGLSKILRRPATLLRSRAGIRPVIRGSRLVGGLHPAYPNLAFFNGLGSKGVLNAPLHARGLIAHLFEGAPLGESIDLRNVE